MQVLTPELQAAQQAAGQVPFISAIAYNDPMVYSPLAASGFTPPTGETLVASDSCVINSSTVGKGILTAFATYKTSTTTYNFYLRFVQEANYGTAGYWQTYSMYTSQPGPNIALINVSITSDNYQNGSSNTFCLSFGYLSYNSTSQLFTNEFITKIGGFASPTSFTTASTFSVGENLPFSSEGLTFYSIWEYYIGACMGFGLSSVYDSVKGTGLLFWESNYGKSGQSASNYQQQGDYSLKFTTMNGTVSGLGTDGTIYNLPFEILATTGRISTLIQNGVVYGAIQGYKQNIPGNGISLFEMSMSSGQFSVQPFEIVGQQDFSNSSSAVIYGPVDMKLTIADVGFDATQYPVRVPNFVLTYSYQGLGVNFTESVQSVDFIHWGSRRLYDGANARQMGLFNTDNNYILLQNLDQDVSLCTRNATSIDVSADIIDFNIQRQSDGSAATLTLNLANNYVGSGVSYPNTLVEDQFLKLSLGYNTTSGNEGLVDAWYLIDTINQITKVSDNTLQLTARDGMKDVVNAGYDYPLQFPSQTQIFFNAFTDQQFNTLFNQLTGTWTHNNGQIVQDLTLPFDTWAFLAFTEQVSPSFELSADFTLGSQAGVGQNVSGASLTTGFFFDTYATNDNGNPYQYISVYVQNPVLVSGNIYNLFVGIYVGPGNRNGSTNFGAFSTGQQQTIQFDITKPFNLKIKRIGCFFMVYLQNQLCSFPNFYTNLKLPNYNVPNWVGPNVYIFDNVQGNSLINGTVGFQTYWNNTSNPPTGSTTPEVTITNIKLSDFVYPRASEFNLADIASLGGLPSAVLPLTFSDTFSNLSNWQTTI